tara:strand:- start:904 stop:1248 length:345 start_codon:yes stop_codon:yes gene_type:complete
MTTNELGTNGGSDTSPQARTGREKQRYDEHEQRLVAGYVTRARVFFTTIANPSPLFRCAMNTIRHPRVLIRARSIYAARVPRTPAEHLHHPRPPKQKPDLKMAKDEHRIRTSLL